MPKNIVICCDGTGNEFGTQNSNVVKLYSTLENGPSQVTYYHPGVGTMGAQSALTGLAKWWTRVIGLAFGYGISENIADAYQFLMQVHEDGDRVFVFGFSRGAYTARALCGLLHMMGLLTRGNENMIPYAIRLFKRSPPPESLAAQFKRVFARDCKPHFLGVWDTVSSVGWVYNAVHFPYTRDNPDLQIVRHALAIDECRAFYRHNLFKPRSHQDVREVWFAGAHSDVGGSYDEAESGLSKIALRWMLAEAELAGLHVDTARKAETFLAAPGRSAPDPGAELHISLYGWWHLVEYWPKFAFDRGGRKRLRINRGRRRRIPAGALIHETVRARLALSSTPEVTGEEPHQRRRLVRYAPPNLGDLGLYQIVGDLDNIATSLNGAQHDALTNDPGGSDRGGSGLVQAQSHLDSAGAVRHRARPAIRGEGH